MHDPKQDDQNGDAESEAATAARVVQPSELTDALRALRAVVIEGPDVGQSLVLDPCTPTRILIGSGPSSALPLTDPTVSRRHLALEPAGRRYRIVDLDSRNGTFVDGVAVVEGFVHGGEVVRCGGTALRLDVESTAPSSLPSAMGFGRLVGASDAMRRLYPLCERLAAATVPVLIEGETGTGKEVLAESLHEVGGRSGEYVVFDCTAVSPSLVEAELFGHERGAFTGATATRAGLIEQAEGGTLLIDEIGELELALQAKLLRVVDRSEFRRVGGREAIRADVRILAATRRDLDREVAAGRFRDDLLHRLAIARIELPPLRERTGDVPLLARFFAQQLGAPADVLTPEFVARLSDYDWPGNVRELRNTVTRRIVLGAMAPVGTTASTPPPPLAPPSADFIDSIVRTGQPFSSARRVVIEEFEKRFVEHVLAQHDGNVTRAAAASGIGARYLRLMKARRGNE